MIPESFFRILKTCENTSSHFPATEVFNEGWMLRLVLDAIQTLRVCNQDLRFLNGSEWFSEARLASPFRPRFRQDPLGEGLTNADAVIGHFQIGSLSRAAIVLKPDAHQFVVAEAKMFSNLSSGTKYAPVYNQAARNVACMAHAIEKSKIPLEQFESVAFVLVAPKLAERCRADTNLEACLTADSIRLAVDERISAYEKTARNEGPALRAWQRKYFLPLVARLEKEQSLKVTSWEELVETVRSVDPSRGEELEKFYRKCREFAPIRPSGEGAVAQRADEVK